MRDLLRGLNNFWSDPGGRAVLAVAVSIATGGSVVYRFVEGLTWLDSIYLSVITLTTVGYGDFSPTTAVGKVFTMFYAVVGIGVFVALVSTVAHHVIEAKKFRGQP